MPSRCSRCAVPNVSPAGSSTRRSPLSSSTSSCFQPAVAAHRERPVDLAGHGQLERGDQVLDVAELPARRAALHREQPGRLEMPGDEGVHALADQRGRADHGDGHARVGPRASAGPGARSRAGHRPRCRRGPRPAARPPAAAPGCPGRAPYTMALVTRITRPTRPAAAEVSTVCAARTLKRPPGPVIGVRRQVDVGVHQDVDPAQPAGQRRVAHVGQPPRHADHVPAVIVDRDDPAHRRRGRQAQGQGMAQPTRRAGDGHDGARLLISALAANLGPCGAQRVPLPR